MQPEIAVPAHVAESAREEAVAALWHVLSARRVSVSRQELRERCRVNGSIHSFADELRARGCFARVVCVADADLSHLELPTILMLRHGSAGLLVGASKRCIVLQRRDGNRMRIARDRLADVSTGEALDLSGGLPAGGSFGRRVLAVLTGSPSTIVSLVLSTVLAHLLSLSIPLVTRVAVDTALPNAASHTLALVAVAMLGGSVLQSAVGWFRERVLLFLRARVVSTVSRSLLEHMVDLPFSYFETHTVGESIQALAAGEQLGTMATDIVLVQVLDGAFAFTNLAVLWWLLPAAALFVLAANASLALCAVAIGGRQAARQDEELAAHASQSGYLVELVSAAATLKATGSVARGVGRWVGRLATERRLNLRKQRIGMILEVASELTRHAVLVVLLVWAGHMALSHAFSVGTLVAMLQLAQTLSESGIRFANGCAKFRSARSQSNIVRELCSARPLATPSGAGRGPLSEDAVALHDVWFRHGTDLPWVLQGCSMSVPARGAVRLVGASGTGKTTILRLMAGLYVPERGAVLIHGRDAVVARRSVAYLPQTTYLFQGSILDNLRVLSGGAPRALLMEAAASTGLHAFVLALPMKYETLLPPGGGNLSGGQRQLIALTACVASERPVILLDEAMSNIDPIARAALKQGNLFADRTVVSVVHETG
jgi:ABC-type bacteriocin/lantibiotic exporter with double-glycine peptidase domain